MESPARLWRGLAPPSKRERRPRFQSVVFFCGMHTPKCVKGGHRQCSVRCACHPHSSWRRRSCERTSDAYTISRCNRSQFWALGQKVLCCVRIPVKHVKVPLWDDPSSPLSSHYLPAPKNCLVVSTPQLAVTKVQMKKMAATSVGCIAKVVAMGLG